MRLAFDDCVFDTTRRELSRGGAAVGLSPKAYALLEKLLAERPRALSKEELHRAVWTDSFVSDNSLARLASELRQTLGDDGRRGRLLRTVHGFGYAWCGEVRELTEPAPGDSARCWLTWGRRLVSLRSGENVVGRSPEASLHLDSPRVSRRHCRIVVGAEGARLEDLGSKNGTYLEGARVRGVVPLSDGDQLGIGQAVLTFRQDAGGVSTETELEAPVPDA